MREHLHAILNDIELLKINNNYKVSENDILNIENEINNFKFNLEKTNDASLIDTSRLKKYLI